MPNVCPAKRAWSWARVTARAPWLRGAPLARGLLTAALRELEAGQLVAEAGALLETVAAARPCARTAGLSRACLRWLAPPAAPQPPPSASGECCDEAAARRRACARRALCSLGVAGERTHAACALGRALGAAEAAAADAADEADCGRAARDRARPRTGLRRRRRRRRRRGRARRCRVCVLHFGEEPGAEAEGDGEARGAAPQPAVGRCRRRRPRLPP